MFKTQTMQCIDVLFPVQFNKVNICCNNIIKNIYVYKKVKFNLPEKGNLKCEGKHN